MLESARAGQNHARAGVDEIGLGLVEPGAAQALAVVAPPDTAVPALQRLAGREQLDGDANALLVLAQTAQQLKQEELALAFADRAVAAAPKDGRTSFWRGRGASGTL